MYTCSYRNYNVGLSFVIISMVHRLPKWSNFFLCCKHGTQLLGIAVIGAHLFQNNNINPTICVILKILWGHFCPKSLLILQCPAPLTLTEKPILKKVAPLAYLFRVQSSIYNKIENIIRDLSNYLICK